MASVKTGPGKHSSANVKPSPTALIFNNVNKPAAPLSSSSPTSPSSPNKSPTWLHAWYDPVAGLKATSHSCVTTADLNGDGEYKLLVADNDNKLKIYKGTSLLSEHALLDAPVAMTSFYSDSSVPLVPTVAVASGSFVFIYKNLRPFYKFVAPTLDVSSEETETWQALAEAKMSVKDAIGKLNAVRDEGIPITERSRILMALDDSQRQQFIETYKHLPVAVAAKFTCMSKLNKSSQDPKSESMLVLGTEHNDVIILNSAGMKILKKVSIPSTPVFIETNGLYDVNYRIVIACRNNRIYTIKNSKLLGNFIETDTQICGIVVSSKKITVGCMDDCLYNFTVKGQRKFALKMPSSITNMTKFELKRASNLEGSLVALANGEVRMYDGKNVLTSMTCSSPVTAMKFGQYGREDATLVLISKTGSLTLKILQRRAKLEPNSAETMVPKEQDIPLNIPKRTQLYVDQTEREREQASEMHRVFQRDLCKLRLSTARSYVKVISDGQGPVANTGGSARLMARIMGVGPVFKLVLSLKNTGRLPLTNVPITIMYNKRFYYVQRPSLQISALLPGLAHESVVGVRCIDPNGASDEVRVFVCNPQSCVPMISAVITMPISDVIAPV